MKGLLLTNPLLVSVVRGPLVESRHNGAMAIAEAGGRLRLGIGDTDSPIFPRSAVKALQALAVVESGAADALGFGEEEIALACASHNGEPRHVAVARGMLEKAGFDESALECGPHPPRREADLVALRAAGLQPGRIHNNCSGKHAGMLALARHLGVGPKGYSRPDHAVQRAVGHTIAGMTGVALDQAPCGIDGCSVPTCAIPLSGLATAFARFASGEAHSMERARACARIRAAVVKHPFMVAGTGRFCTAVMEATGANAFVKTGAEGVFCAAFPQAKLGLALKIDDGGGRAAEVVMASAILALCALDASARQRVAHLARPALTNWAGLKVGEIRLADEVGEALFTLGR